MIIKFFTAETCQPCKAFLPVVRRLCGEYNIELIVFDKDKFSELARNLGVMSVPNMLFEGSDGKIMTSRIGAMSKAALKDLIEGLIEKDSQKMPF